MRCPHLVTGLCGSCTSRHQAVERLVSRLDRDTTAGPSEVVVTVEEAAGDGPAARREARAAHPFGLYGYERVGLVATASVALLVVLEGLPPWAVMLVLLTTLASLIRTRGRLLDALLRVVGGFLTGRPTPDGPRARSLGRPPGHDLLDRPHRDLQHLRMADSAAPVSPARAQHRDLEHLRERLRR